MRYFGNSCPSARVVMSMVAVLLVAGAATATHPGTWSAKADLPEVRQNPAVELVAGTIYAIGGAGSGDVTATVYAYDSALDRWDTEAAADMPTPRGLVGSAVIDDKIYVFGGALNTSEWTATATAEVYDPATNTWESLNDMPTARWCPAAAAVDGKIYVIGGGTGNFAGGWNVHSTVEVFDPATNSWHTAADMPTARDTLSVSVLDGHIYAAGGTNQIEATATLEIYDPATDQWTTGSDMLIGRDNFATAAVDGKIYAFGGLFWDADSPYQNVSEVEVYTPSANTWEKTTRLPDARNGMGVAVMEGTTYLIGGWDSRFVDTYDPDLYTSWTEVAASLPGAFGSQWRTEICAANFNNETANVELVLHTDTGNVHQTYTIDPSVQKSFADVVGDMGITGKGVLEFRSDQPLRMAGRTFNDTGDGTFGQFCHFETMDDGFEAGDLEVWLIGLRQEEGLFRTNLIFANTGIREATMYVSLHRCSGEALTTFIVNLDPGQLDQRLEPFANEGGEPNLGWGFAKVMVLEGAGIRISTSIIDSRTNDATTIVAER
ncbi:MAG: kelch repeat-containing protein [Acidobacteriota bacterium]